MTLLLAAAAAAGLLVVAFVVLLATGNGRAAAVVLASVPVAAAMIRLPGRARYLARHLGLEATGHLFTAVWAAGVAALLAGETEPVRLAAAMAAAGAVVAGVERVVWARFPAEIAFHDGRNPRRPAVAAPVAALAVAAVELAVVVVIAAGGDAVWAVRVAAIAVGLTSAAAAWLAWRRVSRGDAHLRPMVADAVAALRPEVLVHFSGSIQTIYQLDQWMPLVASHRSLLVVRELPVFEAVAGRWGVPTAFIGPFPDLDLVVPSAVVALYVNTGTKNNHLVRFDRILHVQLHHGDSDKPVSSSKTMRLYDHHLVAGPAAVARLTESGVPADSVSMVGRPQAGDLHPGPLGHDRPVVVYAPTWEGYHVDTPFCSLGVIGRRLVDALPSEIDLVVRPHPLTGTADRSLRSHLDAVRRVVERRPRATYVPPGSEPLAQTLAGADLLVADVSSVLVDFLAADRPALVTDPAGIGAEEVHRRFPSTSWAAVLGPDLAGLGGLIADAVGGDSGAGARREARLRLLGDIEDPEARFHEVIDGLVARQAVGRAEA